MDPVFSFPDGFPRYIYRVGLAGWRSKGQWLVKEGFIKVVMIADDIKRQS